MQVFIKVFVSLTILSVCWAGHPCPPKTELGTCTCSYANMREEELLTTPSSLSNSPSPFLVGYKPTSLRTIVECNSSRTLIALEEVVTLAFHRKTVDKLVLSQVPPKKEHTLAGLPSGWLKNTRVKVFEIHKTMLSGDFIWKGNSFEGQEQSLLWMVARNCYLYGALTHETQATINTKDLNKLSYLEGLDLSYNHLTIVQNTAFRDPPRNLTTIILTHNSLQSIETSAFQFVNKLKYINLSHNLLEIVNRNMFPSSAKLEKIDLSWNMLKLLPSDFFSNMPYLKTVNLEQNFLYSMPERPWSSVWKTLKFVDVTGNFIYCDCDLLWLLPFISSSDGRMTSHQTVLGQCTQDQFPSAYTTQHNISALTRKKLLC